jgi:sugar phosphate isomerase/epimerase
MPMLSFSIATPERILDLVKAVNKENFMVCLDTGHVNVFGCLSLTDEIRRLGSYLKVVHIHDNLGDKDTHLFPKEGSIDWQGAVSALREIGFRGVFSLETAPSAALDDESFDKEAKRLFEIAKELTDR